MSLSYLQKSTKILSTTKHLIVTKSFNSKINSIDIDLSRTQKIITGAHTC